jgi:lysozyme
VTDSAQGIDVSSYQPTLTPEALAGLDFAFAKATEGTSISDSRFASNWAVIKAAGKMRGAYHELRPGDPVGQAAWFLAAVSAQGLEPGDMLAVSVSDFAGVTAADALGFLDAVKAGTGGRNPVICYTDLSVAAALGRCTGYPLWIAWPSQTAPSSVAPWVSWHLWQWDETGLDRDAFNGTPAEMAAWIAAYAKPAPAPQTEYVEADVKLAVLKQGSTGQQVRNWQGLLVSHAFGFMIAPDPGPSVEAKSGVDGDYGPKTGAATKAFQSAQGLPASGAVGKAEWEAALAG